MNTNHSNSSARQHSLFLELPVDILQIILQHLDVVSFLRLTSTCTALRADTFLNDHRFWAGHVRSAFRVPNQPVVQNHGRRWRALYKRLHTQSRAYTWGDNKCANLGHFDVSEWTRLQAEGGGPRQPASRKKHSGWPSLVKGLENTGTIADLQCGGWCTTFLSSKGAVYVYGTLNGEDMHQRTVHDGQPPKVLLYPPGYVQPTERHDPSTALRQVSTGRAHVLGLADDGRIWSWYDAARPAVHVQLAFEAVTEVRVRKVVAGWGKSAAVIEGIGIAVWEPIRRRGGIDMEDTVLVLNSVVIPASPPDAGAICNFIALESSIVWSTSQGRVFFSRIVGTDEQHTQSEPIELVLQDAETSESLFATDVQGSFRNFAVFSSTGVVLTSNEDRMTINSFSRIPALQHTDVISVAFGDYHFLALHSTGHITSYGREPRRSGGLGLGEAKEAALRGIRAQNITDGDLLPHGYVSGRRVWFEPEKQRWIRFLAQGGADPDEASERMEMIFRNPNRLYQGELSDWIEQEGSDWEERYGVKNGNDDASEEGNRAYFALSVAAAGWHSGALVLVDPIAAEHLSEAMSSERNGSQTTKAVVSEPGSDELQTNTAILVWLCWAWAALLSSIKWFLGVSLLDQSSATAAPQPISEDDKYVWSKQAFPRLRFSDGTEMPGTVPFSHSRKAQPSAPS